jgi:hypothetical protein
MGMKGQVTGFVAVFAGTIALAAADTVLLDAVESGDSAAAQQLLQQGGDVQARGPDGTTALMVYVVFTGMKCATLVKRSTTTHMES